MQHRVHKANLTTCRAELVSSCVVCAPLIQSCRPSARGNRIKPSVLASRPKGALGCALWATRLELPEPRKLSDGFGHAPNQFKCCSSRAGHGGRHLGTYLARRVEDLGRSGDGSGTAIATPSPETACAAVSPLALVTSPACLDDSDGRRQTRLQAPDVPVSESFKLAA